MPKLEFNEEQVKKKILLKLGAPFLCIELTADHLDQIMDTACRWWIDNIGGTPKGVIQSFVSGQQDIQLSREVEDVIEVVFENQFPFQLYFPELLDGAVPWTGIYPGASGDAYGGTVYDGQDQMPYSGLTQVFQMLELSRRTLSADRDWDFDCWTKILKIFPSRSRSGNILVRYLSNTLDLPCMLSAEQQLFYEYALAESMETLGHIRSKFDSFPVPGGERSLNGQYLLDQAREEKERLRIRAHERFMPIAFHTDSAD